jgi:ribonuclease P protein component
VALPSPYRLKSRHDFQAVFREGIRRHSSYLTLRALRPSHPVKHGENDTKADTEHVPTRIGISISTKVSKHAVVRNRLKRQISAALYHLLRLVIVVKPTAAEQRCVTQQFLQELEQLLAQAEVLNGHS